MLGDAYVGISRVISSVTELCTCASQLQLVPSKFLVQVQDPWLPSFLLSIERLTALTI
jgi:hypothetical protein